MDLGKLFILMGKLKKGNSKMIGYLVMEELLIQVAYQSKNG
jgi:hypothetical protein